MRVLVAASIVLALVLAGCSEDRSSDAGPTPGFNPVVGPGPGDDGPDPAPFDPTGVPAWGFQLCDQGYRLVQPASGYPYTPADRSCDFRVTKPLLDASLFDWQTQHGPGNEVSLAVNPTDPLNLAGGAKDYTVSYISDVAGCGDFTVWNGHFASLDGGRTWSNDLIPGFPGDDRPSPLAGNECNTDPVSVFDSDGTYWHNGLNYRGARQDVGDPDNPLGEDGLLTGSQIFFARSQDKGATFDRITTASYGDNEPTIFNDKNWLAVDPASDHMIHTWTNFYAAGALIEFVESPDAGATWTHPAPITPGGTAGTGVAPSANTPTGQFSMPQYDSDGNVWVIWSSGGGVVQSMAPRADLPATAPSVFQPTVRLFSYPAGLDGGDGCLSRTNFRASIYPVLAMDTSGGAYDGRQYVVFPAAGAQGASIWLGSGEGVGPWAAPREILDLPDDQFMPWIDVGPDGTVHVAYYDCSIDAGGTNMTMGHTWSDDGGATWHGPFWIGQAAFHGDLGHHQNGAAFIGDYIAVDASATGVHFFWADTRLGRSDVWAATIAKDWDAAPLYAPELA